MEHDYREGGTVLLAEDDEAIRMVVEDMLDDAGYRVLSAADARAALALLDGGDVRLLITDMTMPGAMDGVSLAREARARSPSIEVLFCSGHMLEAADMGGVERARALQKPFGRERLLRTVGEMLAVPAALPSPA